MTRIANLDLFGARGQIILMLLAVLKEEGGGTRQGTCTKLSNLGWFDIQDEDWPPYPTMLNHEPRWRTVVAWARKDAFDIEYLDKVGHNHWQISRKGRERYLELKSRFASHELDVRRCYMWRPSLKRFMDPSHVSSPQDALRPHTIYRDQLRWEQLQDIFDIL